MDDKKTSDTSWGLIPLTPEYIDKEHGSYVKALTEAISEDKVTNVALSGNYGVGKSSILQSFSNQEEHKNIVIEISLSTISPATTEDTSQGQASTLTNRIQKEIVKQLLYRVPPHETPGSRFRRIEQFSWRREATNSALVSLVVMFLFLLTGWTKKISTALLTSTFLSGWENLYVFSIAFTLILAARYQSYGRLHIKQFATGAATITLDGNSTSYFDQYLDEIVYFFQVSKRTIVVFEDIDRFDDSNIFETLRSLNRLLNNSPQIGRKVRFIYAIKDSIFDYSTNDTKTENKATDNTLTEDPAQVELIRANRTKFFDLVIPVVPFISHRSARDLLKETLDDIEHTLTPELINIAGRYVPDMRLLKNVRNEFIVFRDRILSGDGAKLNLVENELLGMMLYKSTHLADFELIRLGKSNLDKLYEFSRVIVTDNVRRIDSEISSLQQSSGHLKSIDSRSKEFGIKLFTYIQRTARHASIEWRKEWLLFRGNQITQGELQQSKFWTDFLFSTDGPQLTYGSQYQRVLDFSPNDVSSALSINHESNYWEMLSLEQQEGRIEELQADLKFLRSADMGALIERPEFKSQAESLNLHDKAVGLLTNGLAYQLVRANAINRNFTLYTATFHGKFVTPAARSFIIHNVEQDKMDMHYQMNEADVHSLIKECGVEFLGESAFYNITILDCLLRTRPSDTYKMVAKLRSFGDEQLLFLQAYFSGGQYGEALVAQLTYNSPQIFKYLISTSELAVDVTTRQKLVSAALANAWRYKGIFTISAVEADFMRSNYASLATLTVDKLEGKQIQSVVKIFQAHDIRVPNLAALSESLKQEFTKHHLYDLNIDNFRVAVGGDDNLSLDTIHNININVYNNVIANLPVYLDLLEGVAPTVADHSYFTLILEHVYQEVPDHIETVVSRAHKDCRIIDLNEINHDIWSCLARQMRFPPSFGNILAYTTLFDGVDANLAKILMTSKQITETSLANEEDKRRVAIWLLSESEVLPNASLRVNLTVSLDLEEYIDVEDIPAESGELFALMVDEKNKIVEDSETTYSHIMDMDWPTKESFIGSSEEFANYIDSKLLAGDLTTLLQSQKIDLNKKRVIVARADDLMDHFNTEDFVQLTQFAVRNKFGLSIHIITAAASAGAKSEDVLELLEPYLSNISDEEITGVMQALGGHYKALTQSGSDKPSFPNDQLHNALVNRLKTIGIVTKPTVKGNYMWVNKRRS